MSSGATKLQKTLMQGMYEGRRYQGRPARIWFDYFKDWIGLDGQVAFHRMEIERNGGGLSRSEGTDGPADFGYDDDDDDSTLLNITGGFL